MFLGEIIPLPAALGVEAFVSIHMSLFVLKPLADVIADKTGKNSKTIFWTMFSIRVAVLLFFDLFITTGIAFVDFLAVFVGAFGIVPVALFSNRGNSTTAHTSSVSTLLPNSQTSQTVIDSEQAAETAVKPAAVVSPTNFDPAFPCRRRIVLNPL